MDNFQSTLYKFVIQYVEEIREKILFDVKIRKKQD